VQSILTQTFQDFELLIIDDGSTDSTSSILSSFNDSRIRLLPNDQNIGLISTLNRGLALASGQYVARMDADDIAAPERLSKQVTYLDTHPDVHVVGTMVNLIDEQGIIFGGGLHYPTEPEEIRNYLLRECCLIHPSTTFRKETVIAAGGYAASAKHAEDYDLWLRLSDLHKIANLPDTLLSYRMHKKQVSVENIKVQHEVSRSCRLAAIKRRRSLGENVVSIEKIVRVPLWNQLSAGECSLGLDYLNWACIYRSMKYPEMGLKLAFKAVTNSPFSLRNFRVLIICIVETTVPQPWLQAAKWYLHRVSILLRIGRISS
jgi:glycosyltransferase involved in cell wall biosynthesis